MTIDEVYRLVQTFANKEQRGFITPSEFNLLAKQAELELYNKRLSLIKEKSPTRRSQGIYAENLTPELAKQDIASFLSVSKVDLSSSNTANINSDYIESIFTLSGNDQSISSNIPVEIVDAKDINQILRSSLVSPSIMYPIALMIGNSFYRGTFDINVFPESIDRVSIYSYYYDKSNPPKWAYVTVAGKPVYDPTKSRFFMISSRVHGEIVIKILEYLGVTIREADLVQYAQASELKADS